MGVTAIKLIENRTSGSIKIVNVENPKAPGSGKTIRAGGSLKVDLWVPWATNAREFAKKHIFVETPANSIWIWQAAHRDGDFVRSTDEGAWRDRGTIGGDSSVDGDRRLIIAPAQGGRNGAWLSRTMSGKVTTMRVTLQRKPSAVIYAAEVREGGGTITTIRNHAAVAIYLRQSSRDRERHIAAGETSTIFAALKLSPQWYARVPEGSGALPPAIDLDITAWT